MLTVLPDRLGPLDGKRVLDLGCGAGRHSFMAWRAGASVVALDADPDATASVASMLAAMTDAGELACPAGGALVGDAYGLPFPDATFDVVIASEIFEHLVDDHRALAEVHRVLADGGVFAISVPRTVPEAFNWLLSSDYHRRDGGHVRIYRRRQLLERLERAGFELARTDYRHGLHSPYWWLRCALGVDRPERRLVAAYHRLLVWEIERGPRVLRVLGRVLDPLIGKSFVCYLVARPVPGA